MQQVKKKGGKRKKKKERGEVLVSVGERGECGWNGIGGEEVWVEGRRKLTKKEKKREEVLNKIII